jgi:hypothetical protein
VGVDNSLSVKITPPRGRNPLTCASDTRFLLENPRAIGVERSQFAACGQKITTSRGRLVERPNHSHPSPGQASKRMIGPKAPLESKIYSGSPVPDICPTGTPKRDANVRNEPLVIGRTFRSQGFGFAGRGAARRVAKAPVRVQPAPTR